MNIDAKSIAERIIRIDKFINFELRESGQVIPENESVTLARAYLTLLACKSGILNEYHGDDDLLDDDSEIFVNESVLIAAKAKIAELAAANAELATANAEITAENTRSKAELESTRRGFANLYQINKKHQEDLEATKAEFKELKIYYDDLLAQTNADEYFQWQHEREYYKELELRYEQLLEESNTQNMFHLQSEDVKLREALNRIGILASSEHAYTSEFTERCKAIVQEALRK